MPLPLPPHGTQNRWRRKCRYTPCQRAHHDGLRAHRRNVVDTRRFPPEVRARLLELRAAGVHITDAAAGLQITQQTIHAYARVHPDWGTQLDEALTAGRDPNVPHGIPSGYRHHQCRCPECRRAHREPAVNLGKVRT